MIPSKKIPPSCKKQKPDDHDYDAAVWHLVHYCEDFMVGPKLNKNFDRSVLATKCRQVRYYLNMAKGKL